MSVRPKKHLGQHFLTSEAIADRIAGIFDEEEYAPARILEIGPGTGVLTRQLATRFAHIKAIELDKESVAYLLRHGILTANDIVAGDFLRLPISDIVEAETALIGNFPYNISTQIVFKVIECRHLFPLAGGMFQKEVAERIAASPGTKTYGILSVWAQAFYDISYCFTVNEGAFNPPPKVKSGVIRMRRRAEPRIKSDPAAFLTLVKTAFGQRRKMLRGSLKNYSFSPIQRKMPIFDRRPETLTVEEFDDLLRLLP